MAVNPETTVRKLVSIPRELWAKIEDYRFDKRMKSESEAMRTLIEVGLAHQASPKKAAKRP
jgi:metal-responsive CopG/Arc/MetJ family transcriptional regulator